MHGVDSTIAEGRIATLSIKYFRELIPYIGKVWRTDSF